jgi:hypothetical protein
VIQDAIKTLLSSVPALTDLVGDQIKPIVPGINATAPGCTYQLDAGETPQCLDGPSSLRPYTLTVTVYDPDLDRVSTALDGLRDALDGYTGGQFLSITYQGESEQNDQDETVLRTQTYQVWYSNPADVEGISGGSARITQDGDTLTLVGGTHTLELGPGGLTLDGQPFVGEQGPQGPQGDPGPAGADGADGAAATILVGPVTAGVVPVGQGSGVVPPDHTWIGHHPLHFELLTPSITVAPIDMGSAPVGDSQRIPRVGHAVRVLHKVECPGGRSMGWERRGNGTYYYTAARVGGRVVKRYVGTGEVVELAARLDAIERESRTAQDEEVRANRGELEALAAPLDPLDELTDAVLAAALFAAGYHRHHRGPWRKRRARPEAC